MPEPKGPAGPPASPWTLAGLLATSLVLLSALLSRGGGLSVPAVLDRRVLHGSAPPAGLFAQPEAGSAGSCSDAEAVAAAAADDPASPWAEGCYQLSDACVDNGNILLYSQADRATVPFDIVPSQERQKYDGRVVQPPIHVRAAALGPPHLPPEGAAYLRRPVFSRCTVPVVWYSMWPVNFAHAFRDNAAKLWGVLNATSWAPHMKLVLVTGGGLAAPRTNHQLYQPLLNLRVESWADFSARLPSVKARGGDGYMPAPWLAALGPTDEQDAAISGIAGDSPDSWEGGPQRCFRRIFVCNRGLNITTWPLHALGKKLVQHYSQEVAAATATVEDAAAAAAAAEGQQVQEQSAAGLSSGSGSSGGGAGERVLRVVFHKRGSQDRQLLNAAELLQRCNAWRHTTKGGQRLRARCWEAGTSGLFEGMAAAQQADVFVAMHGANQANTWLMRDGGAMIELQPFGFDKGPAHQQYPLFNMEDANTRVQWWMISACDPQLSTPGVHELRGEGTEVGVWSKNRNLRLGWEALEHVLATAVEVAGDMADYRRRWREGRWWWWLGPNNKLLQVGPGRITQLTCPDLQAFNVSTLAKL